MACCAAYGYKVTAYSHLQDEKKKQTANVYPPRENSEWRGHNRTVIESRLRDSTMHGPAYVAHVR